MSGIKLDGALVTHPDADHLDGVERLFRELLPPKYQDTVTSDNPKKRLMCNGPVLLTTTFSDAGESYGSFSEFLLDTEFEIILDDDDIRNAFGNDIFFKFPTSRGVLYQRQKRSQGDKPYSKTEQEKKLKGCADDKNKPAKDHKNKSSILLLTERGGKICLNGDAHGYDIAAMLVHQKADDLDIFKLSHHGSPNNCILRTVVPPQWVFNNLAAMVLLSLSLKINKISFAKKPEEESDIDCFRNQLTNISTNLNGETIHQVADAFLKVLNEKLKNTNTRPEDLFNEIKEKHIKILTAIQKPSGAIDPYKNIEALKQLVDWETLRGNVVSSLSSKKKLPLVKGIMGSDKRFRNYFEGKVGMDAFFDSFHSKTYYVSANTRHGHPSPQVIRGIIKAAVKKNKPCRIVFTSGGAVPSENLPDSNVQDKLFKDWNKLVSLYYLKDNVSFKLDPTDDINTAPSGTTKFENDDKIRKDVTAQLEENFGFTLPQRTFLPSLDKYYVKIKGSDRWLAVKSDGTLTLSSKQSAVNVSNANTINGDLRVITLESEHQDGDQKKTTKKDVQKNVWLEADTKGGYRIRRSADGDYFFEENDGSLKSTSQIDKAATFSFQHKTFSALSAPVKNESNLSLSLMEYLQSLGHKSDQPAISVQSVLEILLGVSNIKLLIKNLPSDFIGIAALYQQVNCKSCTVELSSSVDRKVISSKVVVITPTLTFDSRPVTKLEIVAKELCSKPSLSLLMSTTLDHVSYTVNIGQYLKPRKPSVDMYLNALGDVSEDNRNDMTLGILLQRVMGLLPMEALSNCLPAQLLSNKIFTWKVDRFLSTVDYFISPLAVEVLSGDFYVVIPPKMKPITFGGTMIADFSRIHFMIGEPRTERSNFVIECDATIRSIPVNLKMAPTSKSLPEVIISFPENPNVTSVFNKLGLPDNIHDLSVPLVKKVIRNLQLSKPSISVSQDVPGYKVTRISSLSFEFSFDNSKWPFSTSGQQSVHHDFQSPQQPPSSGN